MIYKCNYCIGFENKNKMVFPKISEMKNYDFITFYENDKKYKIMKVVEFKYFDRVYIKRVGE